MVPVLAAFLAFAAIGTGDTSDACDAQAGSSVNALVTIVGCQPDGTTSEGERSPQEYEEYDAEPACPADPTTASGFSAACTPLYNCPTGSVPFWVSGLRNGTWTRLYVTCRGGTSTPTITPATVATAFQRIPLPQLTSIAQPGDKTLVNFDTVFHVQAQTLVRDVTILGQDVELTITPSRFRWTFGDGTSAVTTTPGHAYPAKSLTHRYQAADVTVRHTVEVTWTATWRVNNGPWQDVPGTVTITGPRTALRVAEATPLLAGGDD